MGEKPSFALRQMVESEAPISEIASLLDQVAGARRVQLVRTVRGKWIGKLYDLARGTDPVALSELVPESTPAGATVVAEGRNSLPVFSLFQKRFTRTADGLVFGHNAGITAPAIGPGYFSVSLAKGEHQGEILFDYTEPPPFEPAGWPRYADNERRLSKFVFANMLDYVRRVCPGVFVGSAYKRGVEQDAFFTLTFPS